ncbi:hypothetical protein AB0912_15340 [Streptomyces sp. NPDC007084]|uniref:hypothetical protein n=1 Tax=Streptomyces sp. NPDC007084 TaxID=3154313 RepID=UPI0034557A60
MNLRELAVTSYTEYQGSSKEREDEAREAFEKSRDEFLDSVRRSARDALCPDAGTLDWRYTSASNLPDNTEEATALIDPGSPDFLRYRFDYAAGKTAGFELVRPCRHCGQARVDPVSGLLALGALLAAEPEEPRT